MGGIGQNMLREMREEGGYRFPTHEQLLKNITKIAKKIEKIGIKKYLKNKNK